jgi:Domain of unknown function (DUF5658)
MVAAQPRAPRVSTVVFVDPGLDESLPEALRGADLARERRVVGLPSYPGPERRRRKAPRLEPHGNGLAVVHTCPDCGLSSIVPYRPGAGLSLVPPCPCTRAVPAADTRGRDLVVGAALVLLWLLNLDDVLLTRRALAQGAVEANAIMGQFLRLGFVPAALIKMAVVTAGAVFLWSQRRRPIVLKASVALAAVYLALVVYQIVELAR